MKVPFDRMTGLLIIGYRPQYTQYFNRELVFTFEEYVKSQLHLNVMADLYGRDIYLYDKALKYIRGQKKYLVECSIVLKYFYQDVTNMMCSLLKINPTIESDIKIVSDLGKDCELPVKIIKLSEVVKELEQAMSSGGGSGSFSDGVFAKFSYKELDSLAPNELLATASIYLYYGSDSIETCIIEVV